jgi:plastocyanin
MRPAIPLTLTLCLAAAGELACSYSSTDPSLPNGDVTIVFNASTMGNTAFSPDAFSESFATRAQVIWVNADRVSGTYGSTGTTHRLVSDTPGVFDSGLIGPGKAYSFTFPASGTYTYHCTIHPNMVGSVTLTP